MEEKGRPWLSKLGVATETTGVVSEWVDWETPRRWALFCRRKQSVRGGRRVGCFTQGPTPKPTWATQGPGGLPQHGRPQRHTQVHTGALKSTGETCTHRCAPTCTCSKGKVHMRPCSPSTSRGATPALLPAGPSVRHTAAHSLLEARWHV